VNWEEDAVLTGGGWWLLNKIRNLRADNHMARYGWVPYRLRHPLIWGLGWLLTWVVIIGVFGELWALLTNALFPHWTEPHGSGWGTLFFVAPFALLLVIIPAIRNYVRAERRWNPHQSTVVTVVPERGRRVDLNRRFSSWWLAAIYVPVLGLFVWMLLQV